MCVLSKFDALSFPCCFQSVHLNRQMCCMQIAALRRCSCLVETGDKSQTGSKAAKDNKQGIVFCSNSGALGWLIPVSNDSHQILKTLCSKLHTCLEHVAGLNPHTFRARARELTHMYGPPAPLDGVLDFELMHQFCMLPRSEQKAVALKNGVSEKHVVQILCQVLASAAFF